MVDELAFLMVEQTIDEKGGSKAALLAAVTVAQTVGFLGIVMVLWKVSYSEMLLVVRKVGEWAELSVYSSDI